MKNPLICAALVSACFLPTPHLLAADDYIVQTDLASGTVMHIYVDGPDSVGEANGIVPAIMEIGESGARFQMYGVGLAPDSNLYLLSETVVGAFMPAAEVSTWSKDPYAVVTRTRADQPFNAKMIISNLSTDPDAPDASKSVYVERLVSEYPADGERTPIDGTADWRVVEAYYVINNGELQAELNTSLRSEFAYKQKGEELIRIYALPDTNLGWTVIDEKKVQVWPIADGEIQGILTGSITPISLHGLVLHEAPTIRMSVTDLYPSSQTYLQIYKGPKSDSATGIQQLPGLITANDYEPVNFNTTVPQSAIQVITADQWEEYAKEDGIYTVEIVTKTPFNNDIPERLAYATFEIKRTIKINADLHSAE